MNFKDELYHKGKIILLDFNENKIEINFTLLSDKIKSNEFNIIERKNGIIIEHEDSTIKDINIQLSDGSHNGIYHKSIPIERISERKYFIKYPEFKFDVISYQPIYKTGDRGPTQFHGVNNNDIKLDGEINFINKERGVIFEFIEKEFSNKNPLLGLLLNDVLYKYPLHRIEKNRFVSNLFYPLELRGLTKASIFYIDSTVHQLSSNINSKISILGLPFSLTHGPIQIESNGEALYDMPFEREDNTETFIYIKNTNNPNPDLKAEFYYGPFQFGPEDIPLRSKYNIIYNSNNLKMGIYKYDSYNKEWKFLDNDLYDNGIGATVKSGGTFAVIKDTDPPLIQRTIPKVGSTYRHDHFDYIKFYIEDEMSGISNENNIKVFLDDIQLIVEYNPYRKVVSYKINQNLKVGAHNIRIEVEDNSENKTSTKGTFYIK